MYLGPTYIPQPHIKKLTWTHSSCSHKIIHHAIRHSIWNFHSSHTYNQSKELEFSFAANWEEIFVYVTVLFSKKSVCHNCKIHIPKIHHLPQTWISFSVILCLLSSERQWSIFINDFPSETQMNTLCLWRDSKNQFLFRFPVNNPLSRFSSSPGSSISNFLFLLQQALQYPDILRQLSRSSMILTQLMRFLYKQIFCSSFMHTHHPLYGSPCTRNKKCSILDRYFSRVWPISNIAVQDVRKKDKMSSLRKIWTIWTSKFSFFGKGKVFHPFSWLLCNALSNPLSVNDKNSHSIWRTREYCILLLACWGFSEFQTGTRAINEAFRD